MKAFSRMGKVSRIEVLSLIELSLSGSGRITEDKTELIRM